MINLLIASIVSVACGLFGAYGGAEKTSKGWRRVTIPLILSAAAYYYLRNIWVLTVGAMALPLSLGYGLPSLNDPEPSDIGEFWYLVFGGDKELATVFTRFTIGIIKTLCLISIPLLKGSWIQYYSLLCVLSLINIILGGDAIIKHEGSYTLFGKRLLWEETLIYGLEALAIVSYILSVI
jgi:hypothetical protein